MEDKSLGFPFGYFHKLIHFQEPLKVNLDEKVSFQGCFPSVLFGCSDRCRELSCQGDATGDLHRSLTKGTVLMCQIAIHLHSGRE